MKTFTLSIFCFFLMATAFGQETIIHLENPSFEDMPRPGKSPTGWTDCGFIGETPPDVQPDPTFSVNTLPYEGSSYLGLVVRDNDTWESVCQRLKQPIKAGHCYQFSIYAARSETYISASRSRNRVANYNTPAKLQIWGGYSSCEKTKLIGESEAIFETEWVFYSFKLQPSGDYDFITLQAYFDQEFPYPYNGNILLDNASSIVQIDCSKEIIESVATNKNVVDMVIPDSLLEKLDTIQLISPNSLQELNEIIITNGPKIQIDPINSKLEQIYYYTPGKKLVFQNPYIHFIAHALKEYPGLRLIISVNPPDIDDPEIVDLYIQSLKQEFYKTGLPPNRLTIRPHAQGDHRREWLIQGLNSNILIRYNFE